MVKALTATAITAYAFCAIATFGHAYHYQRINAPPDIQVTGAFFAALGWPLYVSVRYWDSQSALERSDGCPVNSGNIGEN